jgi:CBS domain-containing protein
MLTVIGLKKQPEKKRESPNMQTATKKTKSKKSRKIRKAKGKKSKPIKSAAKKVPGEKTDAGKLYDPEGAAQDQNTGTNSIDPKESKKESDTVEGSTGKELKQEQPSVEEILTETINTNKIKRDAQAGRETEDNADPQQAAAGQSKVDKSKLSEDDVSSDQENIAQDPNAANDSTDSNESDEEPAIVEASDGEESGQERPTVEETSAETSNDEETKEHVQEGTIEPENISAEEQKEDEESMMQEPDVSSDREDTVPDPNAANTVDEVTAEVPETSNDFEMGKVSEAIRKIAQSSDVPPDQSEITKNPTPGVIGNLFEIHANDIMQNQATWASPDDSLQHAFAKMQQTDAGYIMIGLNGALEGIVSKSDITRAMSPYLQPIFAKWRRPLDDATLKIRIKWIMSRPVRTIKPETPLAAIMEHMIQFRGRCLPVTDEEGNVQGLVTAFDIFRALLKNNSNTCSEGQTARELVESASPAGTT